MNKVVTRAMVLAAGEGTRLKPLTDDTPKALLPVGERPVIEWQLMWLKKYGVTRVMINLHHLGDKIREHLGDGSSVGVELHFSPEKTLMGTAGGLKLKEDFFKDTFIVLYGDVITDLNLQDMLKYHISRKAIATLALVKIAGARDIGLVTTDKENRVTSFTEKPGGDFVQEGFSNGGIYVVEKEIFKHIPPGRPCDFAYDIFPELIKQKMPVYGYLLEDSCYLKDIGTHERYKQANEEIAGLF